MLPNTTEEPFRQYIGTLPQPYKPDLFVGGKLRTAFEQTWLSVVDDPDVQSVVNRMLFIPSHIPDWNHGLVLLKVLDHLHGKKNNLKLFDDVIVTQARIEKVTVSYDNEGPTYSVVYTYGNGKRTSKKFGYDTYHAAINGWHPVALNAYWKVGNLIACHYRAHWPHAHCVCEP